MDVWRWVSLKMKENKLYGILLIPFPSRRICPGMIVAEREIWLSISRMLWAFTMTDIPGKPIDLNEYDGLSGRSPVPFEVLFTPRHNNVKKILDEFYE